MALCYYESMTAANRGYHPHPHISTCDLVRLLGHEKAERNKISVMQIMQYSNMEFQTIENQPPIAEADRCRSRLLKGVATAMA